ncbi:chemotaxis protein histidine kinase CheA [Litorivivens lipolytica]|uniref:Chemotaxis protein histidine kinase CheA n=1 Tax=Litorivivens lipolytica TaxID=1524264 RepID=A0A7W4W2J5_9GAMM|nr:hypothetical protein [Litorivivens lipolytica]MBB3046209.1 chemotaxis protein histidine kinase CheA [Litorivivens lipolytica]
MSQSFLSEEDAELREFFAEDATELLVEVREILASMLRGEATEGGLESVRRGFHNLKGAAMSLPGCDSLESFTRLSETLATALEQGVIAANPEVLTLLDEAAAAIQDLLAEHAMEPRLPLLPNQLVMALMYCQDKLVGIDASLDGAQAPVSLEEPLRQFRAAN